MTRCVHARVRVRVRRAGGMYCVELAPVESTHADSRPSTSHSSSSMSFTMPGIVQGPMVRAAAYAALTGCTDSARCACRARRHGGRVLRAAPSTCVVCAT